jgi:hypothetical protein
LKRLTAADTATRIARTEAIVSSCGLPNCEIRILTGDGRLTFDTRQLGSNQRAMNRALIGRRRTRFFVVFLLRLDRFLTAFDLIRLPGRGDSTLVFDGGHADVFRLLRVVDDFLGRSGGDRRQDSRCLGFLSLARHTRVLVFVVRVARRATRLLDVLTNHRDDDVVGQPSLARTVVIQNVTRPKLALLHQELPMDPRSRGKENAKGAPILAELVFEWQ